MRTEYVIISDCEKSKDILEKAGELIRCGELVAFPTETVYGLGASALSSTAAERIYTAKGRPSDNPLIVHIAMASHAEKYAHTTPLYYRIAERFMPGPITVVMPKKDIIPSEVTGGLDTVALRCPENPIARKLIECAGIPIAAPSANRSGCPSPTSASHVKCDLDGRCSMIIDGGECDIGVESTVVAIIGESCKILRPGAVTAEMLRTVCTDVSVDKAVVNPALAGNHPSSPGMKYKHYSPEAEVILVDGTAEEFVRYVNQNAGENDAVFSSEKNKASFKCKLLITGKDGTAAEENHSLYSLLRQADAEKIACVYIKKPPKTGEYLALYNRLIRAAAGRIVKA